MVLRTHRPDLFNLSPKTQSMSVKTMERECEWERERSEGKGNSNVTKHVMIIICRREGNSKGGVCWEGTSRDGLGFYGLCLETGDVVAVVVDDVVVVVVVARAAQ